MPHTAPRLVIVSLAFCFAVTVTAPAQGTPATENSIRSGISNLRSTPDAQRGARTGELARQIATLPAGKGKTSLALGLAHLSTEGDPGRDNLQAVTDTLAQSLAETPVPGNGNIEASPYMELAELVRYEGMTVSPATTAVPDYKAAMDKLAAVDDEIGKANFTLKDLHGKKWTLSELRGKVVLVNFWATWCPPCRLELPNLDAIAAHFEAQGLVILAITDEDGFKVNTAMHGFNPHYVTLLDDGHKVGTAFHVRGIPKTFVFDREGKLVAQSIDMRTQRQFLQMLGKAGLKP